MTEPARNTVRNLLLRAADSAIGDNHLPPAADFRARQRATRLRTAAIATVVAAVLVIAALTSTWASRPNSKTPPAATGPAVGPLPSPGRVTASELTRYRWSTLPHAPIAIRSGAASVWTGTQMIVWGGETGSHPLADGAAYTPTTRAWTKLPPAPLTPRLRPYALWTGTRMIIWGGLAENNEQTPLQDGAVYDPSANTWTKMAAAEPLKGQAALYPTYTVGDLVWAGKTAVRLSLDKFFAATRLSADAYNPATNRWSRLPDIAIDPVNNYTGVTATEVSGHLVVWISSAGSYRLSPSGQSWTAVNYKPDSRCIYKVLAAGSSIIYPADFAMTSCGGDLAFTPGTRGVQYDLHTKRFRELAYTSTSDAYPITVWTGSALLNANTAYPPNTGVTEQPGETAAWDPRSNTWLELARQPASDTGATWVWTGTQLLGFGRFRPRTGGATSSGLTLHN